MSWSPDKERLASEIMKLHGSGDNPELYFHTLDILKDRVYSQEDMDRETNEAYEAGYATGKDEGEAWAEDRAEEHESALRLSVRDYVEPLLKSMDDEITYVGDDHVRSKLEALVAELDRCWEVEI